MLADHTGPQFTGNFRSVAIQCLDRVPTGNNKFTFTANQHSFNFLIENGYTYLVVADEGWVHALTKVVTRLPRSESAYWEASTSLKLRRFGRQVPFAFLEAVKNEFRDKYGEKARTAQAGSLDRAFG